MEQQIQSLLNLIFFKKKLVYKLIKRLNLIRAGFVSKTQYEKNEIEITEMQTDYAINKHVDTINSLEYEIKSLIKLNQN